MDRSAQGGSDSPIDGKESPKGKGFQAQAPGGWASSGWSSQWVRTCSRHWRLPGVVSWMKELKYRKLVDRP